jgi:hypothetical protein
MPTQNPRINMTLPPHYAAVITKLAKRDHVSISAKAAELILFALEHDEDMYFSKLAEDVERRTTKWVSHEEAWK